MEHGCVAFVGKSVSDEETALDPGTAWPAHPNYFLGQRMEILQLSGVLRMTSNESAKVKRMNEYCIIITIIGLTINYCDIMMTFVFVLFSTIPQTIILMKVNPKVHLPQMVINFLIKKMAGVFLYLLQKKAVSVRIIESLLLLTLQIV